MKAIGEVSAIDGQMAIVVSHRNSACSSCRNCDGKGTCHAELIFGEQSQTVTVRAINCVDAKAGDTVELESETSKTLIISMIIFLLPLIVGVVSYYAVSSVSGDLLICLVTVLLVVIGSFILFSKLFDSFVKKSISIKIVRILEESDN